jgi:hypothetical protein
VGAAARPPAGAAAARRRPDIWHGMHGWRQIEHAGRLLLLLLLALAAMAAGWASQGSSCTLWVDDLGITC